MMCEHGLLESLDDARTSVVLTQYGSVQPYDSCMLCEHGPLLDTFGK
jgi:hypothetical protein